MNDGINDDSEVSFWESRCRKMEKPEMNNGDDATTYVCAECTRLRFLAVVASRIIFINSEGKVQFMVASY